MDAQDHLDVFPSAASAAGSQGECPEVTPCIAELLRTGYNPPYLLLRVERVLEVPILFSGLNTTKTDSRAGTRSTSGENAEDEDEGKEVEEGSTEDRNAQEDTLSRPPRHRTFRLFLSDSELLIQALLKRELHSFVSMGEVVPGCVMRVESFELRWADRAGSMDSHLRGESERRIAFLAVERFRTVWVPGFGIRRTKNGSKSVERGVLVVKRRGVKRGLEDEERNNIAAVESEASPHKRIKSTDLDIREGVQEEGNGSTGSQKEVARPESRPSYEPGMLENRDDEDLHALLQALSPSPQERKGGDTGIRAQAEARRAPDDQQLIKEHPPSALQPIPSNHIPIIGDLVTLSSLLNPPHPLPRRNYIVSLLAIVSSISAHTWTPPPHARLPRKRDLRIVDSSIPFRSSGVHLSVFAHPDNFFPRVGSVVLFLGLKTHEWEGVSLNAFDGDCAGREWFIDDQRQLESAGYNVRALREWWAKRCAEVCGS